MSTNPLLAALGRVQSGVPHPSIQSTRLLASVTGHDLSVPEIGSWFSITVARARLTLAVVESDDGPAELRWTPALGVTMRELRRQRKAIGRAVIEQSQLDGGIVTPDEAADLLVCGLASCAQRLRLDEPPNGLQAILAYCVHQGAPVAPDDDDAIDSTEHAPLR